jgi:hypothetical protein
MKWQAATAMSSSTIGLVRGEAAALFATLAGIECALHSDPTPGAITCMRERLETMARMRDHAPLSRAVGR